MVIVDEAYAEFARPGTPSALTLLPRYPRLVVTRTMSKAFAFAGARVGYLAADPAVVEAVQLVRLPYHLSALTQAAARAALATRAGAAEPGRGDQGAARPDRHRPARARADGGRQRRQLRALRSVPATRKLAWQALLDRGVLVRDVGLAGWLRVTAGTPEETDAFLTAMGELPDGVVAQLAPRRSSGTPRRPRSSSS